MLNSKTINSTVNDYYSDLNTKILAVKSHNRNVLNNIEGFNELENKIGNLKLKLAKAEYNNDTNKCKEINAQIALLSTKLNDIVKSASLIKYKYQCPICKDTGYINNKQCKCYLMQASKVILNELGIKNQTDYSLKQSNGVEELKKHYAVAQNYVNDFPSTKVNNFIFTGTVGSGKTHLSKCIFTELTVKGNNCIYLSSNELNNLFIKMHVGEIDRVLTFEMLTESDLLVIDDLGTEPIYNNVTAEYFLPLISTRLQYNKHFIITTNLTHNEIKARYGERLLSRLSNQNETMFVTFPNQDLRKMQ